jgi:hypothetical protein
MTNNDYTQYSVGTMIRQGEIRECPHCGRRGLREEVQGNQVFTHITKVGFNNGPTLEWDICPRT